MADILETNLPALSATSDTPVLDITRSVEPEPPVDKTAEQTEPDATASEEGGEGTDAREQQSGEGDDIPAGVKAALSRAKNREKAANERAAKLEEQLAKAIDALPRPKAEEPPPVEPRPKRDTFDDADAYDDALIAWAAKQTEGKVRETVKAETAQEATKRQADEMAAQWLERRNAFAEEHPDYEEVAEADSVKITQPMAMAIAAMEDGPAIAYHLGQNPEIADKVSRMNPVQQVAELGRLAASLGKTEAAPSKPKPDPIKPVGSRQKAGTRSPDEMSGDEYYDMRAPQLQRRSTAGIL